MKKLIDLVPEGLRKYLPRSLGGNLIIGRATIEQEGDVVGNIMVGKTEIRSRKGDSIRGNISFGRTRIVISGEVEEDES